MECIKKLQKDEAKHKFWNSISKELGFERFIYYFNLDNVENSVRIYCNLPDAWRDEYLSNNYSIIDPIHVRARGTMTPFYWGGEEFIRLLTKQQRKIYQTAKEYGIKSGYTVPIHAPNQSNGSLTFASNRITDDMKLAVKLNYSRLHILAIYFHDLLHSESHFVQKNAVLTNRERECLILISNGKKYFSVAADMGVSTNTVQFHMKNIKKKLKVNTVQQAVAVVNSKNMLYV